MKALLLVFVIYINYVIGQTSKYAVKNYPKKVRPYGNGKILINSGKYMFKSKASNISTHHLTTKRLYTVFQVVGNSKTIQGVPDSPYFPVDQSYDQKPRVKKVLPDYAWSSLRNKRSVVHDSNNDEKGAVTNTTDKKREPIIETTSESKFDKKEKKEKKENQGEEKSSASTEKKDKEKTETKEATKSTKKVELEKQSKTEHDKPIDRTATENKVTEAEKETATKPDKKDNPKMESKNEVKKVEPEKISKAEMRSQSDNSTQLVEDKVKEKKDKSIQDVKVKNKKNAANTRQQPRAGKKKKNKLKRKGSKKSKGKSRNNPPQRSKKKAKKGKTKRTNGTRTLKSAKAERRLIGAREALIEDYPYVVSIQKDDQHWCSGALLNPRLVITTANCLWKANRVSRMEVRAGSRHIDREGQLAGIQEVMKHPGWGLRRNPDNDVALILLDRNIKFSDSVHGVDLPNRVMLPPFDDAWVTSWGAERRDGIYDGFDSTTLQVYHTRLIERAKCNNITMRFSVIVTENFICLAQSGMAAPCTRDTGAPAVSDGVLWGLASWGIRKLCGTERFPAMFSYLASHSNLDFITNATHYLMADKRFYPFADRFPTAHVSSSSSSSETDK